MFAIGEARRLTGRVAGGARFGYDRRADGALASARQGVVHG
jgi:hypothetical protein